MNSYHLTVVTPDGCLFDGQASRLVCRTVGGDVAILAGHCDYCTALGRARPTLSRRTVPAVPLPASAGCSRFWADRSA